MLPYHVIGNWGLFVKAYHPRPTASLPDRELSEYNIVPVDVHHIVVYGAHRKSLSVTMPSLRVLGKGQSGCRAVYSQKKLQRDHGWSISLTCCFDERASCSQLLSLGNLRITGTGGKSRPVLASIVNTVKT